MAEFVCMLNAASTYDTSKIDPQEAFKKKPSNASWSLKCAFELWSKKACEIQGNNRKKADQKTSTFTPVIVSHYFSSAFLHQLLDFWLTSRISGTVITKTRKQGIANLATTPRSVAASDSMWGFYICESIVRRIGGRPPLLRDNHHLHSYSSTTTSFWPTSCFHQSLHFCLSQGHDCVIKTNRLNFNGETFCPKVRLNLYFLRYCHVLTLDCAPTTAKAFSLFLLVWMLLVVRPPPPPHPPEILYCPDSQTKKRGRERREWSFLNDSFREI